jgi:hypothetical protein
MFWNGPVYTFFVKEEEERKGKERCVWTLS